MGYSEPTYGNDNPEDVHEGEEAEVEDEGVDEIGRS